MTPEEGLKQATDRIIAHCEKMTKMLEEGDIFD